MYVCMCRCGFTIHRTMVTCTDEGALVYWPEGTTKVTVIRLCVLTNDGCLRSGGGGCGL